MAIAGLVVELLFSGAGLIPKGRHAKVEMASVRWNYTTVLNILFLLLAAVLLWRFVRTGGLPMLRMMNRPMPGADHPRDAHAHGAYARGPAQSGTSRVRSSGGHFAA
jgi:hypothetical protein